MFRKPRVQKETLCKAGTGSRLEVVSRNVDEQHLLLISSKQPICWSNFLRQPSLQAHSVETAVDGLVRACNFVVRWQRTRTGRHKIHFRYKINTFFLSFAICWCLLARTGNKPHPARSREFLSNAQPRISLSLLTSRISTCKQASTQKIMSR